MHIRHSKSVLEVDVDIISNMHMHRTAEKDIFEMLLLEMVPV